MSALYLTLECCTRSLTVEWNAWYSFGKNEGQLEVGCNLLWMMALYWVYVVFGNM